MKEMGLPGDVYALLPGAALDGAAIVGCGIDESPARIINAINDFVARPTKKSMFRRVDNWNDRAMPLGALWGTQLVRQFGWQWIMLDDDGDRSIGVFDAIRSQGIFPFEVVFHCILHHEVPTMELAFNMISDGTLPKFEPQSFTNIMDGIRHIVPPS